MKKIMFKDKYGLTDAVLNGNKTMTRREIPIDIYNATDWKAFKEGDIKCYGTSDGDWVDIRRLATYRIGEVVAVAQSYKDTGLFDIYRGPENTKGWNNKMFVRSDVMPHQIRITDIKVEQLQDISDEDCIKEGVAKSYIGYYVKGLKTKDWEKESHVEMDGCTYKLFPTPREAFAALIDKVSGKGTWDKNEYVFAYTFKLIK